MLPHLPSHTRMRRMLSCALLLGLMRTASAQVPFNLAAAPDTLFVSVNNIAIAGEYALRGKTANFHYPVLSMLSVVDDSSKIVTGLADTVRWLNANENAENGLPITQIWPRLFEYHRDNPLFPPNPDLYQTTPGVSFTEVREWQNFPTSTMLVMDVSGSLQERLADAKAANLFYVDLLRPVDRAGVVQFDHSIVRTLPMTNDFARVRDTINAARLGGSTAIYDALALSLRLIKNDLGRRRVVILYTDGNDNASTTTPQAVIDSAQAYGIPIYTIALGFLTSDNVLQEIAQKTGGLFFKSPTEKEMAGIYLRLSDIVQNFYVMAHGSPDPVRNNTWRTVDVTASLPNRTGRGQGYYFVPSRQLAGTDLALAFTALTDTQVVINGRSVNAVKPGAAYRYRMQIKNLGPARAENIRVRQFLPDSVRMLSASRTPLFTDGDSLLWQISSLAANAEDSILVDVQLAAQLPSALQDLISNARMSAANDTTPTNNAAFDTVRVTRPIQPPPPSNTDLAMSMASFTDTSIVVNGKLVRATKPGSEYAYRLKVRNLGPRNASNIRVRQLLPDSVSFVNASQAPSFVDQDSVAWSLASLNVGSEDSINVTVKLATNVTLALDLLLSETKLFFANDTTPANNAAFDTVRVVRPIQPPPPSTDLAMSMTSFTDTSVVVNGKLVRATKPGREYAYRLKIRNHGPRNVSNIRVRQLLPDSVSFVNASLLPSFFDKDSVAWSLASLNSGREDSINVTVKLTANVPLGLDALFSDAKLFFANDTTPANNAAFDTVRVVRPIQPPPSNTDLAMSMASFTDTSVVVNGKLVRATKPGREYAYRLKVRNHGPRNASNIRVRQLLPDSVSFVNASLSPSFVNKDSVAWQLASLNSGSEDSINVNVKLAANVPLGLDALFSEAKLFFANDTMPANNAAFDTVRVVRPIQPPPVNTDLAMSMSSFTDTSIVVNGKLVRATKPGSEYAYRLKVRNLGPRNASNIRVRQLLPDSVSFVNASRAPSFVDKDSVAWQVANLQVGKEDSINVTVKLATNVPLGLNLLFSEAKLFFANDTMPANNAAFDTVRVVRPIQPPSSNTDLAMSMSSFTDTSIVVNGKLVRATKPGSEYAYRLKVRNRGPRNATNIRMRQLLPDSVSFVRASLSPSFFDKDSVAWQVANLQVGKEDSINVTVKLAANVPLALDLLLSEAKLFFANDTTPANNAAFDTVRVVRPIQPPPPSSTDLAMSMTSFTDTSIVVNGRLVRATKPGSEYEYRLKIRNVGPRNASNIRVRQLLPDSVRFVNASLSPSFVNKDSVAWQVANLQAGREDSINVTIKLAVNVPLGLELLFSEAKLFFANDTTPANNAAFDTVRVTRPIQPPPSSNTDLAMSMTSSTDTSIVVNGKLVRATKPGSEYEYRLKVRNRGPRNASNIRVRQLLPDSVSFVNASLFPSFVNKDSVAWSLASLNAGREDSINVTVKLAANVPLGLNLLFSEAKLFFANDTMPANNAAFDTVRVVRPIQPPPPLNTDLAMSMSSSTDTSIVVNGRLVRATKPGSEYAYHLKVRNRGPGNASNIRVRQLLPDSVSFVNASLSPSFVDKDSVAWQVANLQVGKEDSINVTVKLATNVPLALDLLLSETKLFFANDTTPTNNAAFDTVRVVRPIQPPSSNTDLAMSMSSFTDTSIVVNGKLVRATKPGSEYAYRLKVRNLGPRNASNIRVRQLLPDSVRFVGASRSPSFFDKDSVAWQLASLNAGREDSINVTVKLAANVPLGLDALFSEAKLFFANDTTPTNNTAFDTVRVVRPIQPPPPLNTDLAMSMTSFTDTSIVVNGKLVRATKPGSEYAYRLKVRNRGPSNASNIRVRQLLPDSVSFVNASRAPSFVDKDSVAWQVANLQVGKEDSINVTVKLATNVPLALDLLLSETKLFFANDTTPTNNAAFDTVRVVRPAPPLLASLVVTQRAQTDSFAVMGNDTLRFAAAGETYRYTLTVSNTSDNEARNVRLTDFLPDSIAASGFQPLPSFANRDSARWTLGNLAPRSRRVLTFNATVSRFMRVGTNLLVNRIVANADNLDLTQSRTTARDTVRNIVRPLPPLFAPLIEARPPVVNVGEKVFVRVQVLDEISSWDLWVYFANGDIDSSFADAFIAANPQLTPNVWHDVAPSFNNTRLVTAAKQEELRFEIRTHDRLQRFANASASVLVQSNNAMALDRNVYEPERENGLNINFKLSSNRKARLEVYDLAGHYVTKLAEGEYNAGWNTHVWNGVIAENGCIVGSGVYLVLLRAGEYEDWKKVIIVR